MSEKKTAALSATQLVLIAGVAGLVAGAAWIYVKETSSGNGPPQTAAIDCSGSVQTAARMKPLAKGEVAALSVLNTPVGLTDIAFTGGSPGKPMTLSDFKGKPVLINLWATWCVPCREEMPELDALQAAEGGKDFEVVAVNVDNGAENKPKAFLEFNKITNLAFYRENTLSLFNAVKKQGYALGLPVTLLVDGKGCLIASMNGPAKWASRDASAMIKALKGGV